MHPTRQALAFEASTTAFLLALALLFFAPPRSLRSDTRPSSLPYASGAETTAQELVQRMVRNEVQAAKDDRTHWRFRKVDAKRGKSQTWEVIETKDGELQRLLAIDGHTLTKAQQEADQARLRRFLDSPREQEKKKRASSNDFKKEQQLMEMLPKALVYQYAGNQGGLIRLTFEPNAHFHGSTREAEVFHHMTGELWISRGSTRLAQLRGQLATRVNFGGGFLGHLNKGGTFDVKQQDVGGGHWDTVLLDTDLTGKALFFKTIGVQEKITESDYQRVSDTLTLRQAAELLKKDAANFLQPQLEKHLDLPIESGNRFGSTAAKR